MKKENKKIIIIVLVFVVLFIAIEIMFSFLTKTFIGKSMDDFERMYKENNEEWEVVVNKFLEQQEIQNIQLSFGSYTTWEGVNRCSRHSSYGEDKPYSCTEGQYPKDWEIELSSIDEVLEHQNISREMYDYFYSFMERYKIRGMGKNDDGSVELEDVLAGIAYYSNSEDELKENIEYINVNEVNDHWYTYYRDWN